METRGRLGVHELAGLIMGASEDMRGSFEEVCGRYELTPQQARTLLALKEEAPMRSLASHLRCDPSNVTGIADRLEARGLIHRAPREEDRRVKLLALTEQGGKVRDELEQSLINASPVMANLSEDERETLAELLRKLLLPTGELHR